MKELSGAVHRAVDRNAILASYFEILLAVAGRSMYGPRTLLERHVIGQNAERVAIEKWMAENGAFQLVTSERRDDLRLAPATFLGGSLQQFERDDVHIAVRRFRCDVFKLWMIGDRHVG